MSAPTTLPSQIALALEDAPRPGETRPAVIGADCPICPSVGRCEACAEEEASVEMDALLEAARAAVGDDRAVLVKVEQPRFVQRYGRCDPAYGAIPAAPAFITSTAWEVRSPFLARSNRPDHMRTRGRGRTPLEAIEAARMWRQGFDARRGGKTR